MLIAKIPKGTNKVTVKGLTQWDKGQQLQIECEEEHSDYEVHFAIENNNAAIKVSPTITNGVGKVLIPDVLLQQTTQIQAWLYCKNGESVGETVASICLPITARAMPTGYAESTGGGSNVDMSQVEKLINSKLKGITKIRRIIWEEGD